MIAILDYGVGNLFSLTASLDKMTIPWVITRDSQQIDQASHLILPGVGAFEDAIHSLETTGVKEILLEQAGQKPFMGICLGMQLLFEKSYEFGEFDGLGLIPGEIIPIKDQLTTPLKVPQMGWNKLEITQENPLLKYTKSGDYVYFVHSYFANTQPTYITSTTDYQIAITATVANRNIVGCQFHPEKSGDVGLGILKAFYEMTT